MLQLCSYETHALGYSAFCTLFSEQDFLNYEYYYDLVRSLRLVALKFIYRSGCVLIVYSSHFTTTTDPDLLSRLRKGRDIFKNS